MLLTRLLPFLFLLSLSPDSLSQDKQKTVAVPETCRVTKPSDKPFTPPLHYPAMPYEGTFWFGSNRLWTALPVNGTWRGLPHYTPDDPSFRQKLFFWRQGYDPHAERSRLTVTGRRTDSLAPPLLSDQTSNGSWKGNESFIVTGINFPTVGCWEITGHYESDKVTFVVWVAE